MRLVYYAFYIFLFWAQCVWSDDPLCPVIFVTKLQYTENSGTLLNTKLPRSTLCQVLGFRRLDVVGSCITIREERCFGARPRSNALRVAERVAKQQRESERLCRLAAYSSSDRGAGSWPSLLFDAVAFSVLLFVRLRFAIVSRRLIESPPNRRP